jgi:phage portal protein BeeE
VKWVERLLGVEERAVTWDNFAKDVADAWFGSSVTKSGERITEETSLQVSAVFASVRVITEPSRRARARYSTAPPFVRG